MYNKDFQNRLNLVTTKLAKNTLKISENMKCAYDTQQKFAERLTPNIVEMLKLATKLTPTLVKMAEIHKSIAPIIEQHRELLTKLDSSTTVPDNSVSQETTDEFINTMKSVINDLPLDKLPDDTPEEISIAKENISTISDSKGKLTLEKMICYITFILLLIQFVQSQLPNKQLKHIGDSLDKLVEIEMMEYKSYNPATYKAIESNE